MGLSQALTDEEVRAVRAGAVAGLTAWRATEHPPSGGVASTSVAPPAPRATAPPVQPPAGDEEEEHLEWGDPAQSEDSTTSREEDLPQEEAEDRLPDL